MNALAAKHDAAVQMIDTSIIRVHQHAACIARNKRQSMGRSRGGLTTRSGLKREGRHSAFLIFLGVEKREILADDFVGDIASKPLRAGISARHNAGTVQHVDCINFDRLDEKAVTAIVRFGKVCQECPLRLNRHV